MTTAQVPSAREWISQGQRVAAIPGESVHFRDRGVGPNVLLLHGFPTWSYEWAPLATSLERRYRVVCPDLPGYGASDKQGTMGHTVALVADAVQEICRQAGISSCHLVVHDYGSMVGQELLDRRRRGDRALDVHSVTVLNASIFGGAYRPTIMQRALLVPVLGPLLARGLHRSIVRRGLDRIRARPLTDEEFRELAHGMWLQDGPSHACHQLSYIRERQQQGQRWEVALERYDGPVQLIWGLQDPVSGPRALEIARGRLRHAEVTTIDDAGHFPHAEQPAKVIEVLSRFLARARRDRNAPPSS